MKMENREKGGATTRVGPSGLGVWLDRGKQPTSLPRLSVMWPSGSAESVTVAPKTMAGEVQNDDDQHKHTNRGVEDLDS